MPIRLITRWRLWPLLLVFALLILPAPAAIHACPALACAAPAAQSDAADPVPLFEGITYQRLTRTEPDPVVIHVVRVDLDAPGLRFFVTPGEPGGPQPLHMTSTFAAEYGVQLAINANYFSREAREGLLDYFYVPGELVTVGGLAISDGVRYSPEHPGYPAMYIAAGNRVSIGTPLLDATNAIAGDRILLSARQNAVTVRSNERNGAHPRTAVGIDASGRTLFLVVVDGRQPGYSEGVTLWELVDIFRELGAYHALNLDGGGSSTLVAEDANGEPAVINRPVGNRFPGSERPVAVQLGIYAAPLAE